jgi:hypothetical protein
MGKNRPAEVMKFFEQPPLTELSSVAAPSLHQSLLDLNAATTVTVTR